MKYLLIYLFPFFLNSQVFVWDKDDVLHHYCGVGISVGSGLIAYKIQPEYSKHRALKACVIGFGCGLLAGYIKESVYDRKWQKGTYSNYDIFSTGWGSLCGSAYLGIGINIHERRRLRKLNPRLKFNK